MAARHMATAVVVGAILLVAGADPGDAALQGDLDGNGLVNEADLAAYFAAWRDNAAGRAWNHKADLSGDGLLDHTDAEMMVEAYIVATCVDPKALLVEAEGDVDANRLSQAADKLGAVMIAQPTWVRPKGVLGVVRQLQGLSDEAQAEYAAFALMWRTQQGKPISPESDRDGRFYWLLNQARLDNSLWPLKPDARLSLAAWWHSDYMRTKGNVQHDEPDRPGYVTFVDRMLMALGWNPNCPMAENIAANPGSADQATVDSLHSLWMNSPLHRANILSGSEHDVGIAVSLGATSMWVTEDFAALPAGSFGPGMEPAEAKVREK